MGNFRNTLVETICNFLINKVATKNYSDYVRTTYYLGTKEFDRMFWEKYDAQQEEQELS